MPKTEALPVFKTADDKAYGALKEELRAKKLSHPKHWAEEYPGTYHNWITTQFSFADIQRAEMAVGFHQYFKPGKSNQWRFEITARSLTPRNTILFRDKKKLLKALQGLALENVEGVTVRPMEPDHKGKVTWEIESDRLKSSEIDADYIAELAKTLFSYVANRLDTKAYRGS